ncbi:hypothetical protein EVAR_82854_1 [Eumeta japonica]|uniref:Uncharacterized protein n=1 Tax=Eumeta variegata TaxID=151549 RepID=A0A4C1V454_EUMVA|nr:hypothetical protein EVAR_82854_1 [Eumeta japonica]
MSVLSLRFDGIKHQKLPAPSACYDTLSCTLMRTALAAPIRAQAPAGRSPSHDRRLGILIMRRYIAHVCSALRSGVHSEFKGGRAVVAPAGGFSRARLACVIHTPMRHPFR